MIVDITQMKRKPQPPGMTCRGCGNEDLDVYNDYCCYQCGCSNNVILTPADTSQKPPLYAKLTNGEKKWLATHFQQVAEQPHYFPTIPEATDEDIRYIQEQLRLTANDPNLVIRTGGHW
jgi:hypothetical protein